MVTNNKIPSEYQSVEALIQFCIDDERNTCLPGEIQQVAQYTGRNMAEIKKEVESFGIKVVVPTPRKMVRGVNSNNHDLFSAKNGWVGGGSGYEQIVGFAGR